MGFSRSSLIDQEESGDMRSRTSFFLGLLVGVLAVIAGTLLLDQRRFRFPKTLSEKIATTHNPVRETAEYKSIVAGHGTAQDGSPVSFTIYLSVDDVYVKKSVERHRSPRLAEEALQERLRSALTIVEQGRRLRRDGQQIGDRAVVMLAPGTTQQAQAAVLWTDGSDLLSLESSSLRHALEFEKKLNP